MRMAILSRRRRAAAAALALLATALGPVLTGIATPAAAQAPAPAATPQVPSVPVEIRGNRRIEAATIIAYMALPPGELTPDDVNLGLRRLFATGLFRNARIVPAQGRLVVEVEENPSINEIAFEGNDALRDEDLQKVISLRPRLPLTLSAAEADAQTIIEIYRRTGRYGATVEPVVIQRSENRVDLVFEISEGEETGVNSISFVGNRAFSDGRLREEIETTETGLLSQFFSGDVYDPDRIELDKELLRNFYRSRGYADFRVLSATAELSEDRTGFFITFTVEEGPQYTFGDFDVVVNAKGLEREEFLALIPAGDLTGEIFNADKVEEIANDLTDLAGQKGFAFVRVNPRAVKDEQNLVIGVVFELEEGSKIFVERIVIEGNTATLDRVIRREIELVEGDAFDARKIRNARRDIRGLDYFDKVDVETERGSADDRAVLRVKVAEKSTGSISFGLGFSTSVGPIGNIAVTERNFLGRGQTVKAAVSAAGDTQIYDFSFTEPKFLDRDLGVGFRAFFLQDDRSDESSFQTNQAGITPRVSFPLGELTRLELRYELRRDDINTSPLASPAIQADDGSRFKSSVGYRLSYDARNDQIEPTDGFLLTWDQEIAGLGFDTRFVRSRGTAKGWMGFFDDQVVASLEFEGAGIVTFDGDSKVNDRFFLGGDSLRGFAAEGIGPRDAVTRDAIGGNYMAVVRAEVSFPLGLPDELGVYGGLFLDAGTLFGLDRTSFPDGMGGIRVIDDSLQFRVAAGALLFLDTPLGPLELSFGVPLLKEDLDESEFFRLAIGSRF